LNADGSSQVTVIWVARDDDDIVTGHLADWQKQKNVRRDSRVALSFITPDLSKIGMQEYVVLYSEGRVEEGAAPALLKRLADLYLIPNSGFPPPDSPPGYILRISVNRILRCLMCPTASTSVP
jgi:hypothetical protein